MQFCTYHQNAIQTHMECLARFLHTGFWAPGAPVAVPVNSKHQLNTINKMKRNNRWRFSYRYPGQINSWVFAKTDDEVIKSAAPYVKHIVEISLHGKIIS